MPGRRWNEQGRGRWCNVGCWNVHGRLTAEARRGCCRHAVLCIHGTRCCVRLFPEQTTAIWQCKSARWRLVRSSRRASWYDLWCCPAVCCTLSQIPVCLRVNQHQHQQHTTVSVPQHTAHKNTRPGRKLIFARGRCYPNTNNPLHARIYRNLQSRSVAYTFDTRR